MGGGEPLRDDAERICDLQGQKYECSTVMYRQILMRRYVKKIVHYCIIAVFPTID